MSPPGRPTRRVLRRRILSGAASLAVAAALLGVVLPAALGVPWSHVGGQLRRLSVGDLGVLLVVWLLGLYAYSFVLTAALPTLTRAKALTLNVTGSAVANLVPFGGALGIGLNYAMVRSWGFRRSSFALYTLVTNVWNVLAKLALPMLALLALLLTGNVADHRLLVVAAIAVVLLAVVVGTVVGTLSSERVATFVGRAAETVAHRLLRLVRSARTVHWRAGVVDVRHRTIGLLRAKWVPMSLGMVAYALLQAVLLALILRMLGSTLSSAQVFAAFALERVLTLLVITPGGVGIAETGAAALLVAFGADPAVSAAAVLLFRGFTFFIEIPVGASGGLIWLCRRPRVSARQAA